LTFVLVWFAPQGAGQQTLFFWMLGSMLLYDTCYTIIGLVYSSLLPEVTESDGERNGLQISASLFGLLGMILGFLIPDFFRPKAGTSPSFLPLQISMIVVAVVSAVLIIITTLRVKERPEFHRVDAPLPLGPAIIYTIKNRSFLILAAQNFMSILMQQLLLGMLFYMADYVLQWKNSTIIILLCVFLPLIAGVPTTTLIRKRLGVVRAQQLLLVIAGVGLILVTVAPGGLVLVCLAMAGFGLSGPQVLTNVMFGQVADDAELRTGVRREGAFFGVNALITKPAQSLALTLMPVVLLASGFITRDANGGTIFLNQSASAVLGIRILMGLIPGVALLIGAVLLHWFPLQGERLSKMQADVLALHAEKHARLEGTLGKE
jgi:glycoside/pentoside/hexuronide:cation symporter, GPH family